MTAARHHYPVTGRRFFDNCNPPIPACPTRELWRMETAAGRVIAYETMEEVFFEARTPPYIDRTETLPIIRIVCERNTLVQVGPEKRITLIIEGLSEGGAVVEVRELPVDEVDGFGVTFGHSTGHRFGPMVKSVRITGWWIDPGA